MAIEILRARSLLTGGSTYEWSLDRDQEVGSGGQGNVFAIAGSDQLVKLYTDPAVKDHVVPLVRHLETHRLAEKCAGLQGLPRDVFESSAGQIGVVMTRVPGQSLTRLGYLVLRRCSLSQQLALAGEIAQAVAFLQAAGVVTADLAEPNTMINLTQNCAFLIDIEGGGLLESKGYNLKPLVWGHDQGSLMALELRDRQQLPNFASDNWSLAGLIHRLLSQPAGADAFFYGNDPRVLHSDLPWPPSLDGQPEAMRPLLARHRRGLVCLGPRLVGDFQNTFGRLGRVHPEHRTHASRWARDLHVAQHWVYRCARCGQTFVAEQRFHCPFCSAAVPHAQLTDGRRRLPLAWEARTVTRQQLGLGTDRRPLLRWRRHHQELVVEALDHGCALTRTLGFRPLSARHSYRLAPGTYRLRVASPAGGELILRLNNPPGEWLAQSTAKEATA